MKTIAFTAIAIVPSVAIGWDGHAHQAIVQVAMGAMPAELRTGVSQKMLLEGAVAADSNNVKGSMHGASAPKKLVQMLEDGKSAAPKLTQAELSLRLGMISHLVSDTVARPEMRSPIGRARWLDNNQVLFAYDGPATDALGGSTRLAGLLSAADDVDPLRFDLAVNATIDAWQYVTGMAPTSPVGKAVVGRGTAWAEQGFGITADEVRAGRHDEAVEKSRQVERDARAREAGAERAWSAAWDAEWNAYVHYEGRDKQDVQARASGKEDAAMASWRQASEDKYDAQRKRREMEAAPAPVVRERDKAKVDYGKQAHTDLRILEQSVLVIPSGGVVAVVRVMNNGANEIRGVRVALADGRSIDIQGNLAPGDVRRYEIRGTAAPKSYSKL